MADAPGIDLHAELRGHDTRSVPPGLAALPGEEDEAVDGHEVEREKRRESSSSIHAWGRGQPGRVEGKNMRKSRSGGSGLPSSTTAADRWR